MASFWARAGVFGQDYVPQNNNIAGPEQALYNQGSIVYMVCPFCSQHTAGSWQSFYIHTDEIGRQASPNSKIHVTTPGNKKPAANVVVQMTWLRCQNTDCQEIIVQAMRIEDGTPETWLAVPKLKAKPKLDGLVIDPFRKDYFEAHTILEDSPRMSAVLSRRLLADLLEKYAGQKQFSLAKRIDAFVGDTHHPHWLRQNLHYLREIGDFGAHTQEHQDPSTPLPDAQRIIDVDKVEAEWTLQVVSELFDYFIVAPAKDKAMHTAFDKKIADAGRKPIKPLTS